MSQETLKIRNFGPLTDINLVIRPFTVFVGEQGAGKSTISKIFTICRDLRWRLSILENTQNDIMRPFKEFALEEFFNDNTFIKYQDGADISILYEKGIFSLTWENYAVDDAKELLKYLITATTTSLMKRTGNPSLESIDNHTRNLLKANVRMELYIPAERNITGLLSQSLASLFLNKIPFPNTILEYMSIFEKAKKEFPSYEIPFLNIRFLHREGKDRVYLSDANKELSFGACSSGIQSVLPLLMVVDYSRKADCFDSFVVEEPEQNLFPQNQKELLFFLTSRLNNNKCNFILTTHSPYLLSCLNVQLFAHRLYNLTDNKKAVESIISKDYMIDPNVVAVYSLGEGDNSKDYCNSLISEKTGIISVNELDSVSDSIGEAYDQLYSIYLQTKKKLG